MIHAIISVILSILISLTTLTEPTISATAVVYPKVVALPPVVQTKPLVKPTSRPSPPPSAASILTIDNYPWKNATSGTDTWGYTVRQCVSFAAFRLAQNGTHVSGFGSALNWDSHAKSISTVPRVGAIAHWNAGESSKYYTANGIGRVTAGSYGHVGYVAKVYPDGSALIEQYNLENERAYSVSRMTAPRYLYF